MGRRGTSAGLVNENKTMCVGHVEVLFCSPPLYVALGAFHQDAAVEDAVDRKVGVFCFILQCVHGAIARGAMGAHGAMCRMLTRSAHSNLMFLVTIFQLTTGGGKAFELGCAVFERLATQHLVGRAAFVGLFGFYVVKCVWWCFFLPERCGGAS